MKTETFTFEVVLHYEPEYEGSIDGLKRDIRRALTMVLENVQDIEIALIERRGKG